VTETLGDRRSGVTAAALPVGLVTELAAGRLPWPTLADFPREDPADRVAAAAAIEKIDALLTALLDPRQVEQDRQLPPGLFPALHDAGFLRSQVDPAAGGLGLSDYSTFRLLVAAMQHSTAAGFALAVHTGIGLPALLPTVPNGPVRKLILRRLADGAVSGWADTEPTGAANTQPATMAEPQPGGGYRLTGKKVFISNGTIADELIVSAAAPPGGSGPAGASDACLFLVDTSTDGFHVRSDQEVIGLKGLSLGALELTGLQVPAERVLAGPGLHWRDSKLLEPVSSRGRIYLLAGAALAIAHRCVEYQSEFVHRRTVDGRPLSEYPAVRQLMASSLADRFAIDTVVRWGLLGDAALTSRHRDRVAAKNLTTRACSRIVDRTVSLLAAEGVETAASKQRRGAAPLPVEQLFRDARVLRITGGVDFAVDLWFGESLIAGAGSAHRSEAATTSDPRLTGTNSRHLAEVSSQATKLAQAIGGLARCRQDRDQQDSEIAVGTIAGELLAMTLVLARCADAPASSAERKQRLANRYCADARERLAALWQGLENARGDADYGALSDSWLAAPW
jgi:alkylation response protein AidB-like acyl-CoA dehydrogenase